MGKKIWVVLQQRDGALHRGSLEAIAAGQQLARDLDGGGGSVRAVLLGDGLAALAAEVAKHELDEVLLAEAPALAAYTPGAYVQALAPAIRAAAPDLVVFPHTYQSVDYMARLAQELDAALLPEVISWEADGANVLWRRPVLQGKLQGKVRVKGDGTLVLSVQSGAFSADAAAHGSSPAPTSALAIDSGAITRDREILGVEAVAGDAVDLSSCDVVVAVGRGIGDPEKMGIIEDLAKALGAEIGASRPVIDSGWLPRDRQIGSSGQTVAPKLYVAVGISGAIQHLVGMKGSSCVVAINKDPGAPIFGVADYGLVGDLHELVPALTRALSE